MKNYEYLVVYACRSILGRCRITTDKVIDAYYRVEELDESIRVQLKKKNAIVIDFKLLREIETEVIEDKK